VSERLFVVVFGVSFISSLLPMFVYMMTLIAGFVVTRFGFESVNLDYVPLYAFALSLCVVDDDSDECVARSVFSA
jgi:hypothetical protein